MVSLAKKKRNSKTPRYDRSSVIAFSWHDKSVLRGSLHQFAIARSAICGVRALYIDEIVEGMQLDSCFVRIIHVFIRSKEKIPSYFGLSFSSSSIVCPSVNNFSSL